ncbi:MAG: hypothetical protein ACFB4I_04585 [Cyanophyceae cyanobacterium]
MSKSFTEMSTEELRQLFLDHRGEKVGDEAFAEYYNRLDWKPLFDESATVEEIGEAVNRLIAKKRSTVANTINQLPSSKSDEPGIKELLTELKAAIEAENNLSEDDKKQALAQVKILAEAEQKPEPEKQQQAKGVVRFFRGLAQELPTATKFVEACSQLLPAIQSLFGLG